MNDIKPCPHCGKQPYLKPFHSYIPEGAKQSYAYVCHCATTFVSDIEEAKSIWNKRYE